MKPAKNIGKLIKNIDIDTNAKTDEAVLNNTLKAFENSKKEKSAATAPNIWRTIMKRPFTKLAAAMVILIALLGVIFIEWSTRPAWAIEQTVEALEQIKTVKITGLSIYDSKPIPFKCWIKFSGQNRKSFNMRYECEREVAVVRNNLAFGYNPRSNKVEIFSGPKIHKELQIWYKVRELSPWVAGKILEVLKVLTDNWQETYEKNPKTGSDRVIVTCSYKPLNASFWFVVDLESKLIIEGKHWFNINREGAPNFHAQSFVYNQEIPDEIFDFKIPGGAKVINQQDLEQADALFDKAFKLYDKDKNYSEAITIFQQVYELYPDKNIAEEALSMIGICYGAMGKYQKAIESFEKAIREYPDLKGWIESTYFYLGRAYMKNGQKDKALEAFKNCLVLGEDFHKPNAFPLEHARKYIDKLENEK